MSFNTNNPNPPYAKAGDTSLDTSNDIIASFDPVPNEMTRLHM